MDKLEFSVLNISQRELRNRYRHRIHMDKLAIRNITHPDHNHTRIIINITHPKNSRRHLYRLTLIHNQLGRCHNRKVINRIDRNLSRRRRRLLTIRDIVG